MKRALGLLYRIQRHIWKLLRPRTRGVKVMLFTHHRELILIRNSYGRSDLFVLPGGGIRPFEQPEAAARREVSEELACELLDLALVSTHFSKAEGKRDTVYLFQASTDATPASDGKEVDEVRAFPLDQLPPTVSPATRRRIDEYLGRREADGAW